MSRKIGDAFVAVAAKPDAGFERGIVGRFRVSGRKAGVGFGASFKAGLAPLIAGASALFAAAGVVDFFKGTIAEATEAQKVGAQTAAVLKSTGNAAKISAKQIGDLATAISNKSGVDDEAIQSGENLLLTFTNIKNQAGKGNDVFNRATQTIVDMSAALGQDMKSSAIQVGKALNDPIKGVTALQRVGVSFTDKQKDQIKTLVKSGDTLKAQKIILAELTKEFGGSAAAVATPAEKMKVGWANLKEEIGGFVLPILGRVATFASGTLFPVISTRLVPGIVNLGRAAVTFVRNFDWSPIIRVAQTLWRVISGDLVPVLIALWHTYGPGIVGIFRQAWSAVSILVPVLSGAGTALKAFGGFVAENKATVLTFVGVIGGIVLAMKAWALGTRLVAAAQILLKAALAGSGIGLIIIGVAALAAGIVYLATKTRFFQTLWNTTWGAIKTAFRATMSFLRGNLTGLVTLVLGPLGAAAYVALHWKLIWGGIVTAFRGTVSFLRGLFASIVNAVLGFFGAIVHGAATAFGWVPGIGSKLKKADRAFQQFRAAVNRELAGINNRTVTVKVQMLAKNKIQAGVLHGIGVLAKGGIVKARPGGSLNILGEAGQDELVVPLPRGGSAASGDLSALAGAGGEVHFHFPNSIIASRKQLEAMLLEAWNSLVRKRKIRPATP